MRFSQPWTADAVQSRSVSVASAVVLPVFTAALFLSALLIFVVQPMFAKMVLPKLGGSPAVWSVAMCFFQAALLAGYVYAHALIRYLRPERGIVVHLGLLTLALLWLPLAIASGWGHPPADGLHLWTMGLFAASVGLPFFALAGNAPLLQAWFARTGHVHAADPYFLYGASNVGSLLALLAYPVLLEPNAALGTQSDLWAAAYCVLILLVGASALVMLLRGQAASGAADTDATGAPAEAPASIGMRDRLTWLALAFVPSGLLVAVTSHITTDVAAVPFLWVLPLALFLLTFVITFQRRPLISRRVMLALQPVMIAALMLSMQFPLAGYWLLLLALHLVAFFTNAMVCHGELFRLRPRAGDLTEFYMWMSLGGALGGLFTGLVAPHLFSTVAEYPLLLVLAVVVRPGVWPLHRDASAKGGPLAKKWGLAIAAVALVAAPVLLSGDAKRESHRGFFGINRVVETADGRFRLLTHGTTIHGAQALTSSDAPPEPLTYYHRASPFADVFGALRRDRSLEQVGVVGLGTGSLACYKRSGETWRFFEIDPIVVRLARDRARFRFLADCAPGAEIVVGDARLTLGAEPPRHFDLLVLDAFSSDAIPVHLLTTEAVRSYFGRLKSDGVLLFHVSNRNMDLVPVLSAVARDLGLAGLTRQGGHAGNLKDTYKSPATVVALARTDGVLGGLGKMAGWKQLPGTRARAWTDDYSNVLGAVLGTLDSEGADTSDQ